MTDQWEQRKHARDDLVRVIAQDQMKSGHAVPNMREAERKANEVANRIDRQKDEG